MTERRDEPLRNNREKRVRVWIEGWVEFAPWEQNPTEEVLAQLQAYGEARVTDVVIVDQEGMPA